MIRAAPLLLLLFPGAALAQPAEILVTGRGLAEPAGTRAYDSVAIGRDRLDRASSNRLEDVLRDVPGFQQFRRSDARSANPTSQGASLRGLGGNASSRALVLLDGVPQSDPFGGWISWPAYDPRRLGRILVVRGGGTGAAGPGALAGTIALESAGPDALAGFDARLAHGSRDSIDAFASYGARLGGGFLALSAAFARGDGFVPVIAGQRGPIDRPAPYRQASAALRAIAPLDQGLELQANLSAFADSRERGTAFSDIDTKGADASLRLVGPNVSALAYLQVRDFSNLFAAANSPRTAISPTLDQYNVPSTGYGARAEIRPRLGPVETRLGADWRVTEGRTRELFQFVAGTATRGRVAGGRSVTFGAFAEASWERGPLILTGGARLDHWRIGDGRLDERLLATQAPLTQARFPGRAGWEPTARIGLAWRATPALDLRAAAYLGWRLPTLNELYRPFRVGADATAANAALVPERLKGAEAGLEWRPRPNARLGITMFASRLDDVIANATLGQGPGTFPGVGFVAAGGAFRQRLNAGALTSRGVEIDAGLDLGRFRLAAGYSFADARLGGVRPAQTPRHSLSAHLGWESGRGASAALGARYVSSQYEDDLNSQLIPDALTFDAIVLLPLSRRLALEARAENLTGARVVAGVSGGGIVERAAPRTIWIGLRWRSRDSSGN